MYVKQIQENILLVLSEQKDTTTNSMIGHFSSKFVDWIDLILSGTGWFN